MTSLAARLIVSLTFLGASAAPEPPPPIRIPCGESSAVDVAEVVVRLAEAAGVTVARPPQGLTLSLSGLAGTLSRKMLAERLGPEATLTTEPRALVITLSPLVLTPEGRRGFQQRLSQLADQTRREAQRRMRYGMHALNSYRPNDPDRPTVCLVHGINSSSGGFVHLIRPLEAAGFGVVAYDYPFNRSLEESCEKFHRDWSAFRREMGETRPWTIVAHSMGALLARSYVEDPELSANDVSSLILIGPVNQGSSLAKAQTLLQLVNGVQAVNGTKSSEALAHLADGLGEAAEDLTPGSAFLKALNARPRRNTVAYHILAGDAGFLSPAARRQIEDRVASLGRERGLLGGLTRYASFDLSTRLDELSEGTGDGCVSVARTRLEGVDDHVTIHANHAELIRAPLLYPDPGPIACMPYLLRWLRVSAAADGTKSAPR